MAMNAQAAEFQGLASSKLPPTWSIERDLDYPLRHYRQDLEVWSACSDLRAEQQGPAALLRITGAARELLRELPIGILTNGQAIADPNGGPQQIMLSGLAVLVRTLERRYGASDEEIVIHTISELMRFNRRPHRVHGLLHRALRRLLVQGRECRRRRLRAAPQGVVTLKPPADPR